MALDMGKWHGAAKVIALQQVASGSTEQRKLL